MATPSVQTEGSPEARSSWKLAISSPYPHGTSRPLSVGGTNKDSPDTGKKAGNPAKISHLQTEFRPRFLALRQASAAERPNYVLFSSTRLFSSESTTPLTTPFEPPPSTTALAP
jgi:hypothetical protein